MKKKRYTEEQIIGAIKPLIMTKAHLLHLSIENLKLVFSVLFVMPDFQQVWKGTGNKAK